MFLGGCYYGRSGGDRQPGDGREYDLLERLVESGPSLYIAGHAPPFTRQEALDWLESQR
jgi:hypothetical protein